MTPHALAHHINILRTSAEDIRDPAERLGHESALNQLAKNTAMEFVQTVPDFDPADYLLQCGIEELWLIERLLK